MLASPVIELFQARGIIEIAASRSPANIWNDVESSRDGGVGNPIWRRSVQPNSVDAHLAHFEEVVADNGGRGEGFAVFVRAKSAVSNTFDPEAAALNAQKAALHNRPGIFRRTGGLFMEETSICGSGRNRVG